MHVFIFNLFLISFSLYKDNAEKQFTLLLFWYLFKRILTFSKWIYLLYMIKSIKNIYFEQNKKIIKS